MQSSLALNRPAWGWDRQQLPVPILGMSGWDPDWPWFRPRSSNRINELCYTKWAPLERPNFQRPDTSERIPPRNSSRSTVQSTSHGCEPWPCFPVLSWPKWSGNSTSNLCSAVNLNSASFQPSYKLNTLLSETILFLLCKSIQDTTLIIRPWCSVCYLGHKVFLHHAMNKDFPLPYTKHSFIWQQRDQKLILMNLERRVGDFGDSSLPSANRTVPVSMLTILQQMAMGHIQMKQMTTKYLDQPCHPCKKIACQASSYANGL